MLRCDIITIFPEFFREAFDYGIIRKARAASLVETQAHDLRRWFVVLAVAGLLWSSLMAFRQPDSRGVIAYSSIAQMSLIGLGIFVMNDIGAIAPGR